MRLAGWMRLGGNFAHFCALALAGAFLAAANLCSAATHTQEITLQPGWNAIWLQAEPVYASGDNVGEVKAPADVFTNSAITIVATPTAPHSSTEFLVDTTEPLINQPGWRVWRRESKANADTLAAMESNRAYLVYNAGNSSTVVSITGYVSFQQPQWQADGYTLIGFNLTAPVSFSTFFAGSGGKHSTAKIFKLEANGNWAGVSSSDQMQPNAAYWIYSNGISDFAGPVKIRFAGGERLDFGAGPARTMLPDPNGFGGSTIGVTLQELLLTDVSGSAQNVKITRTTGSDELAIYEVAPDPAGLNYQIAPNGLVLSDTFPVPALGTDVVTLAARRNWSSGDSEREHLYKIEIGNLYYWLPVTAQNSAVLAPEAAVETSSAGLWVGEVTLNEVTSLEENSVQPTTSAAPMRVILHVDASGTARLLSHVMVMQKKTAAATDFAEQVLVIDEDKIPYFEGIEERGGKKVGRRIETTAYDLPRTMDLIAQSALLDDVVTASNGAISNTASVTLAQLNSYLNSRTARPPDLVERYHTTWPLEGAVAANGVLRTSSAARLTLDPFHRANPFRHAFHPRHAAGPAITRAVKIQFSNLNESGRLTGTYEETITGLTAFTIVMRGPLNLERLSTVPTLE